MFIAEMSRQKAGCGESRTSGLGEGMRKRARAIGCARRIPIPHFELIEGHFGAERKLTAILPAHIGKFFKSDALLKKPSGADRAKPTTDKTKRVFRMFLFWAKEQGHIDNVPLPKDTPMGRSAKKAEAQVGSDAEA